MAQMIIAADLFDDIELDLWGNVFRLREGTRSVAIKLAKLQKAQDELADDEHDKQAASFADILDALLEPIASNGQKPATAKSVVMAKWKADELGLDRLVSLSNHIQTAALQRGRPT